MSGSFLDTNVLIYAASADPLKAVPADALIAAGGTISVQVLNEFANVAQRKLQMPWNDIRLYLRAARALLTVESLTVATHAATLRLAERYGFHIYDATIVAAALQAGCDKLYSEDMHDGLEVDGKLRIVNPFAAQP